MPKLSIKTALISCICNSTDLSVLRIRVTPLINFIIVHRAVHFTHISGLRFAFSDYFRSALFDFQIRLNWCQRNHVEFALQQSCNLVRGLRMTRGQEGREGVIKSRIFGKYSDSSINVLCAQKEKLIWEDIIYVETNKNGRKLSIVCTLHAIVNSNTIDHTEGKFYSWWKV